MKEVINLISLIGIVLGMLFLLAHSYRKAIKFFRREDMRMTVNQVFFSKEILGSGFHLKSIFWLGCSVLFINLSGQEGWMVYFGIALSLVAAILIFYLSIFLGITLRVFFITLYFILKESLESLSYAFGCFCDALKKLKKL